MKLTALLSTTIGLVAILPSLTAGERIAFVVGVDNYEKLGAEAQLNVAVGDAKRMAETLESLDPPFQVTLLKDTDWKNAQDSFDAFLDLAQGAECALVYFAGHGVEYHGENFLLVKDTDVTDISSDVERMKRRLSVTAISLQGWVDSLDSTRAQVKLVILDCCRDNPLKAVDGSGTRSVVGGSRGLAQVTPPSGTLISYSADAGQQANDGLFTEVLTRNLKTSGHSILKVFAATREEVRTTSEAWAEEDAAKGLLPGRRRVRQEPAEYSKLNLAGTDLTFNRAVPVAVKAMDSGTSAEMAKLRKELANALEKLAAADGNEAEMAKLRKEMDEARAKMAVAEKTREEEAPKVAMIAKPKTQSESVAMDRSASTPQAIAGGGDRESPGNPPLSDLDQYVYWKAETVRAFERLLVQADGQVVRLFSIQIGDLSSLPLQVLPAYSFKTRDNKIHSISRSEWMLDVLFRGEIARDFPVFLVEDQEVLARIGVTAKPDSNLYSYNEIVVGRAELSELVAKYVEKQDQYEKSAKDPQFELDHIEGMILSLGRNISSFEFLIGQFGFARHGEMLVHENILPQELNDLAKKLNTVEMLDKMPEMAREQLVQTIRQQPGESEDERMFSAALRLFFFHAHSASGLNIFPPHFPADENWFSAGDLLWAGLESKQKRPWAAEQLGALQSLVRSLDRDESAFRDALDAFAAKQAEFAKGYNSESQPSTPPKETASNSSGLIYETPEGWTEVPGIPMQDLSFTFGDKKSGKCYLARAAQVPGTEGALSLNVNRWRSKMGADPLSNEEMAALPTRKLFGQDARLVTINGDFTPGDGSGGTFKNYRLVGVILASEVGAVILEMTGPRELVEQNESAFDQFVSSVDVDLK